MRAFITGVTGQDGQYLSRLLLHKGYEVYGLVRRAVREVKVAHGVQIVTGDVTDASVIDAIREIRPTEIYHLAAMSHVGESFSCPRHVFEVNAMGAINMLEAALRVRAKFYQASTSELFGLSPPPQNEETPFYPRSPYGAAKLAAYWATVNYREAKGLFACNGILFNHESPLRGADFVTQKVCKYVAMQKTRIDLGQGMTVERLKLGNLDATRDWGHAEDFVRGMYLLMQYVRPKDFVFATGETRSVRDLLTTAFKYIGIYDWTPFVESSREFFRPSDVPVLLGDASRARESLGWKPIRKFDEMIHEMIEAEMSRLAGWEWTPELSA